MVRRASLPLPGSLTMTSYSDAARLLRSSTSDSSFRFLFVPELAGPGLFLHFCKTFFQSSEKSVQDGLFLSFASCLNGIEGMSLRRCLDAGRA